MGDIIAIRVDGNSDIGFGHLMRMKALAHELIKQGAKVIFLSRDPENIMDHQVLKLEKQARDEEDLRVEKILVDVQADMIIIDSYDYTQERLDRVGQLDVLSVYIDDLNRYSFNTDYVINGNLYAPRLNYQGRANLLLGTRYLLMREDFLHLAKRVVIHPVQNVLVTFGAADMENVTPGVLHVLKSYEQFEHLQWHVVIGPVFCNVAEIEDMAKGYPNITLHYNPDIKNLMDLCDISISAAGSTTYELAVTGVPIVLVIVGEDQVMLATEAALHGIAFNAGWYKYLDKMTIYSFLDSLINNQALRGKMAARGQELIDGRGTERVVTMLLDEIRRRKYGHI